MATKQLTGTYPTGFYLGPQYSSLKIDASATVGGTGVTTSASAAPTITNLGSVAGSSSGISLANGGTIVNGSAGEASAALISGGTAIVATGGPARIFNDGAIYSDAVTTTNNGTTSTYSGTSVDLRAGGNILNNANGSINGIAISGGAGFINNRGSIGAVYASSYTDPNDKTTSFTASIALAAGGIVLNGTASGQHALIAAGISIAGATGKIVNYGDIAGAETNGPGYYPDSSFAPSVTRGTSITMLAGGSVTNGSANSTAASIDNGISISGGTGAITNFGKIGTSYSAFYEYRFHYGLERIKREDFAVGLKGSLVNGSALVTTAEIDGSVDITGRVTNFGLISPSTDTSANVSTDLPAIEFDGGGSLVNGSASSSAAAVGGEVLGGNEGVTTITNFGSITSVLFELSKDRLIEEGSGRIGTVDGGGGTLVLGGAAGKGSIAGIGSSITDFASIIVDAGPGWNITGATTIAAGTRLETVGATGVTGALTNQGTIDDIGGFGLGADGTIVNDSRLILDGSGGIGSLGNRTDVALVNDGTIVKTGGGTSVLHASTSNRGTIDVLDGTLDITGKTFTNTGSVIVTSGTLDIASRIGGTGALVLRGGTLDLDVAPAGTQTITFQGDTAATLGLGASGSYANTIKGFAASDTLDLRSLQGGTASFSEAAGAKYGILTVSNGTDTTRLKLYGTYAAADFATAADAGGAGTDVTYTGPGPQGAHAEFVQALFDGAFGPAPFAANSAHDPFAPSPAHETLSIPAGKA